MSLSCRPDICLDAKMGLQRAALEPQAAAGGQIGRLGLFLVVEGVDVRHDLRTMCVTRRRRNA